MKKPKATKDQELLEKLIQGRQTNLQSGLKISQTNSVRNKPQKKKLWSIESMEKRFYTDLTEQFLCSLLTLLFKFLIEKGVGHIVEPRPSLRELPPNTYWVKKLKKWEKFISKREWEYFLRKQTELFKLSKDLGRLWGGRWAYAEVK